MLERTTYEIFDSFHGFCQTPSSQQANVGKTIVFKNLYFINGEFIFNGTSDGSDLYTYPNVHYRHTRKETWSPKILELEQNETIQTLTIPHFYFRESVHGHIAHTLMDDIFSVFYSLRKCRLDYNPFICIFDTAYSGGAEYSAPYDCKKMFSSLFGYPAIDFNHFKNTNKKICFKTFVVGTGDSGLHSYDFNYVTPFQDDIWRRFRNAFYEKAKVPLLAGSKIIYIDDITKKNKIDSNLKSFFEQNKIEVVCWGETGDIEDQLNILKNVKICITPDGSLALNSIFLPDNAVVINLGRIYANADYKAVGWVNDYLYPALSYVDVLYFEDYYTAVSVSSDSRWPLPNTSDLISIIKAVDNKNPDLFAKRAGIYSNFAQKVTNQVHHLIKLDNFSPNARLLLENYTIPERLTLVEDFKRGNVGRACTEQVRPFKPANMLK